MDIRQVGRRYFETYKKEDGTYFKGLLGKPPMTGRYTNYTVGGMTLFTGLNAKVEVGDIFTSRTGRVMMIMDNAEIESGQNMQKAFVVRIMSVKVKWERKVDVIDEITGLAKTSEVEDMGEIWASMEASGKSTDNMHITVGKYTFVTNKPLEEGDTLGGEYRITRVDHLVGVTIADAVRA